MNTFSTWSAAQRLIDVDHAVVAMERRGFRIDEAFCRTKAAEADVDELQGLEALANRMRELGHDPVGHEVWSSPKQQIALFDALGWPRSPVWKKGRVKPGEAKVDQTALEWISARVPEARRLIRALIHLKRVRLCGDWLSKLPDYVASDGRVHPVCGPAGDGDDRVGAVTGRLGIKNPSSNFPKDDETDDTKDIYGVRRAIVAPPGRRIIEADYTALEVVIQADMFLHLFNDDVLARKTAPGAPDIHSVTARDTFGVALGWTLSDGTPVASLPLEAFKDKDQHEARARRYDIKAVRYGRSYGKTNWGFGATLLDDDGNPIGEKRAAEIVAGFLAAEPAQALWEAYCWAFIREHRGMSSYAGRWLDLREFIPGDDWSEAKAHRKALNVPQLHAADIIGDAMVILMREGRLAAIDAGVFLQIHDSLVLDAPEDRTEEAIAVTKDAMERAGAKYMRLPLQVSAGHGENYGDC